MGAGATTVEGPFAAALFDPELRRPFSRSIVWPRAGAGPSGTRGGETSGTGSQDRGRSMGQTRTKPPTLGDRLDDLMWARDDSCDDVAALVGATPADVGRWAADKLVPRPAQFDALAGYLEVDVAEVRRLVLRSQMRKVQREIREGTGPDGARP